MSQLNVDRIVSLAGGGSTASIQLEASGNFNFDTGTLYIDVTNNRVGVGTATPRTTVDIVGTDGMILPKGTTAHRPTAVEGLMRYNSETQTFEGYSRNPNTLALEWGAIGGASGTPTQSTDRYSTDYSVGAVLKSDGQDTYWSFDVGNLSGWSVARIWTHGYVGGGYRGGTPWKNSNRTVHATDTTTDLGDVFDRAGAYMAGSFNDITHFCHSMEDTYRGSSNYTSAMSMATESGRSHNTQWDMTVNRASMGSFQDHIFSGGYSYLIGGGNARTDVFNLNTEVMRTSGFPPNHGDGGNDPTWGGNGRLKGWYKRGNTREGFEWKTESWVQWSTAPGGDGWKKMLSSMLGHFYCGRGNNNQNNNSKIEDSTGVNLRNINFGQMGEENFQMGMRKGYCLGNYNGQQNNNTFKVNYQTDAATNLGSAAQPKGNSGQSSAHCASASSVTSSQAAYDYGTNIPNF